jgi:hypothetical protein
VWQFGLADGEEDDHVESVFPILSTPDLSRALRFYRDLLEGGRGSPGCVTPTADA